MNYLLALPGGVAITYMVLSMIHYGSILTVGM
jgi:hypothetical protein